MVVIMLLNGEPLGQLLLVQLGIGRLRQDNSITEGFHTEHLRPSAIFFDFAPQFFDSSGTMFWFTFYTLSLN